MSRDFFQTPEMRAAALCESLQHHKEDRPCGLCKAEIQREDRKDLASWRSDTGRILEEVLRG